MFLVQFIFSAVFSVDPSFTCCGSFHKISIYPIGALLEKQKNNAMGYVLCFCAFPNTTDFSHLVPLVSIPQSELKTLNAF